MIPYWLTVSEHCLCQYHSTKSYHRIITIQQYCLYYRLCHVWHCSRHVHMCVHIQSCITMPCNAIQLYHDITRSVLHYYNATIHYHVMPCHVIICHAVLQQIVDHNHVVHKQHSEHSTWQATMYVNIECASVLCYIMTTAHHSNLHYNTLHSLH